MLLEEHAEEKMCGYEHEARSDEVQNKVLLLVRLQLRFQINFDATADVVQKFVWLRVRLRLRFKIIY